MRKHLLCEIAKSDDGLTKTLTKQQYIHLRRIVYTRVTLLNARRGSEAARMLIQDFSERSMWIKEDDLTVEDRALLDQFCVVYIMGKGTKLVSVLIPKDCERAMEILADSQVRGHVGISTDNKFIFGYTGMSEMGVIGFNEVKQVCNDVGIPVITATAMRHRSSTIFWTLEGLDSNKSKFKV